MPRLEREMRSVKCDQATKTQLNDFHKYFVRTWLKRIGSVGFSVAHVGLKTNNSLERLHKAMNHNIGQHPTIFKLITRLKSCLWDASKLRTSQQIAGYLQPSKKISAFEKDQEKIANELHGQYMDDKLSPTDYLIQV